jgi:hypothetical protein
MFVDAAAIALGVRPLMDAGVQAAAITGVLVTLAMARPLTITTYDVSEPLR